MPERTLSAFATPSAIFLGIALHELISTFFFLVSASKTSWSTSLFQISVVAWSLCMLQSILQIVLLDYTISPYETANHSMAWVTIFAICANFLTSTSLASTNYGKYWFILHVVFISDLLIFNGMFSLLSWWFDYEYFIRDHPCRYGYCHLLGLRPFVFLCQPIFSEYYPTLMSLQIEVPYFFPVR